jgi:hypothetical protein
LEENFHYGNAKGDCDSMCAMLSTVVVRLRSVIETIQDDPVRDILRVKSVMVLDNGDDGDVDIRKDVRGSKNNRETPKDKDQNSEYHERVWPLQC